MVIRGVRSEIVGAIKRLTHESMPESRGQQSGQPTIGEQIDRLREECGLSIEGLADQVGLHPTNVARHCRDEFTPTIRNRAKYSRIFSKLLERHIVISITQPNAAFGCGDAQGVSAYFDQCCCVRVKGSRREGGRMRLTIIRRRRRTSIRLQIGELVLTVEYPAAV
jgi:hypothetical protein